MEESRYRLQLACGRSRNCMSKDPTPTLFRRVFYDAEPRAVWSLCRFFLLVLSMLYGRKFAARQFLQGAGLATWFFGREIGRLMTFFFATWIMGRVEGRSIADYGLPRRSMSCVPQKISSF